MLNRSLQDLVVQRQAPLTINEIRPITRQLLVAFIALKDIGILYTDLKPENVMLVNHQDEPFRVKLTDFSLAIPASEVTEGMIIQPCAYRAPEVSLDLPISEAIDMWALGCVLASLFFGQDIFNGESTYDVMKTVCCLLGQPQDHLLNAGRDTEQYFKRNRCSANSQWTLKTPEEYKEQNDNQLQLSKWQFDHVGNLAEAVDIYSKAIDEVELEDEEAFLNLLQMLLDSDAEKRITPQHALEHSFVTMSHLEDYAHRSSYTQTAFELMGNFERNMKSPDSGVVFSSIDNSRPEEAHCIGSRCGTPTSLQPSEEKEISILCNKSVQYKVLECVGEGAFGQVLKCVNLKRNEKTAIKVLQDVDDYINEVEMLEMLRTLDPEKNNLVRFLDTFVVDDMCCISFELLDRSLHDLVVQRGGPLTLNEIRPITRQLLVALNALKHIGLLYTDLKPDNVMLVNHQDQPFKLKLIDFGLAIPATEVTEGMIMQPCAYRAPEVSLGLPISEAIDMWGLGCVLGAMFFSQHIFHGESTYDVMKTVCCLLGQPQDHLLNAGRDTEQYFKRNLCSANSQWTLKTPEEYKEQNDNQLQLSNWRFDHVGNLADAVDEYSNAFDEVEFEDEEAFLNLLQMLLDSDAETRITPQHALEHSFVTMSHLADYAHRSSYTQSAFELMVVCPACDLDECYGFSRNYEINMETTDSGDVFSMIDNSRPEEAHCIGSRCGTPTSLQPSEGKEISILCNKSVQYKVLECVGEGAFGQVLKCVNLKRNEKTAIKVLQDVDDYTNEVEMLEMLRTLDPEKNNLVRFLDTFVVDDMCCISFELLDRSLHDLVVQRGGPLTLNEIRPITRQLLVALNALKHIGLLYTDLKPDNVMLVNHQDQPFKLKLIDFGLAIPATEVTEGMIMQPCAYRAPEVSLGLPISEAIDMWGLGCVLGAMFFSQHIFHGESTYDVMKTVCCLLGQPQDHLLNAGRDTEQYFKRNLCSANSQWTLKTPEEYKEQNDNQLQLSKWRFDHVGNLAEAVDEYSNAFDEVEFEDEEAFLNLLQMLLDSDAETRITPQHALEHSFVTMSHLADYAHRSSYTQSAFELMVVCPACDLDECYGFSRNYEINMETTDSGDVFSMIDNSRPEEAHCIGSRCGTPTSLQPSEEKEISILCNKSVQYKVLECVGEGAFGQVLKCVNLKTNEKTAIKVLQDVDDYTNEVEMLEMLRTLDPEKNNLVRFLDTFVVDDMCCISFELLDRSLHDLVVQRGGPLTLNEIRPITRQLLVALNALKHIGLLYTDLKPDNVMLVNHQDQPFKLKLIDFGLAIPATEVTEGMIMQPCAYRAPEVSLGLPISEAIDMWGLGCVLGAMFFSQHIFHGESTYDVMKTVCCLLGQPQDHLLNAGRDTEQYFKRNLCSANSQWTLKTPEEYKEQNDNQLQLSKWRFDHVGNLAEAVDKYSNAFDEVEFEDEEAFLNLLRMLLDSDAETRITPQHALEHSFVTMSHLADYAHRSSYTQSAFELMVVCPACDLDECYGFSRNYEINMETTDSGDVFSMIDNSRPEEAHCIGSRCGTPTSLQPSEEKEISILCNKSVQYKVLECVGEGAFGQVLKCVNLKTNEKTAIKVLQDVDDYTNEVEMLEMLRTLDPEKNNLVRFLDTFVVDDMCCISFELLDRSLYDLVVQRGGPLTLNEIRPITRQLLVAFNALKHISLLYTDLKPENVMLVNHQDQPFKLKLIDFGLAIPASEVTEGMIMQPCAYRAPEVSLGLPISEAIDMWGLGCVLGAMFFSQHIFHGESTYDVMKTVCCLLGQPQDHLLNAGRDTEQYFKRNLCSANSQWTLKTPEEYKEQNDNQLQLSEWLFDHVGNLAEAVDEYSKTIDEVDLEDKRAFLNLLQMLLDSDAERRITPQHALEHSFVTMSHLEDYSYTQTAFELMVICPAGD